MRLSIQTGSRKFMSMSRESLLHRQSSMRGQILTRSHLYHNCPWNKTNQRRLIARISAIWQWRWGIRTTRLTQELSALLNSPSTRLPLLSTELIALVLSQMLQEKLCLFTKSRFSRRHILRTKPWCSSLEGRRVESRLKRWWREWDFRSESSNRDRLRLTHATQS